MRDVAEPRIAKWPFISGDAVFLGAAWFIYFQSKLPMGAWQIFFMVVCVAGGAWLAIMPFLLEYRLTVKLLETSALTSAVDRLQNVEQLAGQIQNATAQWQTIQDHSTKTAGQAEAIATRMTAELKGFSEFMERSNGAEKANLRLEVEKLRRAEGEWLHVLVRILDHVYALSVGAARSGQPRVIEQVGNFQNACRDAARRVGLAPFVANDSEQFNAERHQLADEGATAREGAIISETVAAGFTYQGRLIRPAIVRLRDSAGPGHAVASQPSVQLNRESESETEVEQRELI